MARRARQSNRHSNIISFEDKRRTLRRGKRRLALLVGLVAVTASGAISTNGLISPPDNAAQAFVFRSAMQRSIGQCQGGARKARKVTCVVDGDTGWENGIKWRLQGIDAPELSAPACQGERRAAFKARDRLQQLMNTGYELDWMGASGSHGRKLVRIRLASGRYAEDVLLAEGLAQPWPNSGNVWCD